MASREYSTAAGGLKPRAASSPRCMWRYADGVTDRLYYTDSYLRKFRALVTGRSADGRRIYLDRTAFYPASGGQHLLSAVFVERFGIATVSFHLGQESSTIDLETATLDPAIRRAPGRGRTQ